MTDIINQRIKKIESFGYSKVESSFDSDIGEVKYKFHCEKGHIRNVRWGGWTSGKKECFECAKDSKLNERVSSFESLGFTYVDSEIDVNNNKHYILKCNRGHKKRIMWAYWIQGKTNCFLCDEEDRVNSLFITLKNNNLKPIDDSSVKGQNEIILCSNADGYIVKVRVAGLDIAKPSPWFKNEYAVKNLDHLMNGINGWGINILNPEKYKTVQTRLNGVDKDGYLYELRPANIICQGHKPNWLYQNPYGIHNINKYCKVNRPDYTCVSNIYKNNSSPLKFKFIGKVDGDFNEDDRIFEMDFSHFSRGQGHPTFNMSKGEERIRVFLINNGLQFDSQYMDVRCKNIYPLKFDFAIYDNNGDIHCLVEYDGKQHFKPIDFFGGELAFSELQENDQIKDSFCKDNDIRLIRIPYFEHSKIESILLKELKEVIGNYKN